MKPSHPDAKYIMQDKIGVVLAKGLSVTYKEKPNNPVDFFAKWLLKQSQIQKRDHEEIQKKCGVHQLKEKNREELDGIKKAEEQKLEEKQKLENKILKFKEHIQGSEDLNDNLQDLVDHLQEFTCATACYVGKVDKPIKGISSGMREDEDEKAHLIAKAQDEIQFGHASKGSEFMVDQVLSQT